MRIMYYLFIVLISLNINVLSAEIPSSIYKEGMLIDKLKVENKLEYEDRIKQGEENIPLFKKEEVEKETPKKEVEYELSEVERLYNERIKNRAKDIVLKQFGYDIFEHYEVPEGMSVGSDYVVGPGDEIVLYIWGDPVDILKLDGFYTLPVDREGKIFVPNLGVFYVWGKSVAEIKNILFKFFSKKFKNFQIEVSVGKLRTFPVYVSGFVKKPGVVLANGTSTVLDVIAVAGGVSKNGSLRKIILRRYIDGEEISVDLYDFLLYGKPVDIKVKEGDTVHVFPIGKTVGIYGAIKRSAIYEIKEENSLEDIISISGGLLPSVYKYGIKILRYENSELKLIEESSDHLKSSPISLKDGDLIFVNKVYNYRENIVSVDGYVKYPGEYPLDENKKLSILIKKVGLLPDTNTNYAEIIRLTENNNYHIIKVNLQNVLSGYEDIELEELDKVYFYPRWLFKPIEISGEIENPMVIDYYPGIKLLDALRNIAYRGKVRELKVELYKSEKETLYKVVYLYDLLVRNDPEVNIPLVPGTKIVVKRVKETEKDKTVTILGEVNRPGIYRYISGMRLYDLIIMAGGYTEDAFPKALIFIRESAKKLQQEQLQASILSMEESLAKSSEAFTAAGASEEERALVKIALEKQKKLLDILKQKAKIGLGRIALDIPNSLEELKNSPDNIELQDGDYIYVPAKPNYILVLGDVYNQISLPYRPDKTVEYYLKQVGGLRENAKEDDIYIIKANGRVISKRNFDTAMFDWEDNKLYFRGDFYSMKLDQGDTIVVPSETKIPVLWRPLIKDVTQIIFQALSTAVLAKRL